MHPLCISHLDFAAHMLSAGRGGLRLTFHRHDLSELGLYESCSVYDLDHPSSLSSFLSASPRDPLFTFRLRGPCSAHCSRSPPTLETVTTPAPWLPATPPSSTTCQVYLSPDLTPLHIPFTSPSQSAGLISDFRKTGFPGGHSIGDIHCMDLARLPAIAEFSLSLSPLRCLAFAQSRGKC